MALLVACFLLHSEPRWIIVFTHGVPAVAFTKSLVRTAAPVKLIDITLLAFSQSHSPGLAVSVTPAVFTITWQSSGKGYPSRISQLSSGVITMYPKSSSLFLIASDMLPGLTLVTNAFCIDVHLLRIKFHKVVVVHFH